MLGLSIAIVTNLSTAANNPSLVTNVTFMVTNFLNLFAFKQVIESQQNL